MANPISVALVADTWTLVASSVTDGRIRLGESNDQIIYTFREAGGTAPTHINDNGLADIVKSNYLDISHGTPADVYLLSKGDASTVVVML